MKEMGLVRVELQVLGAGVVVQYHAPKLHGSLAPISPQHPVLVDRFQVNMIMKSSDFKS